MDWGFVWLMLILKIPLIALLLLVWWAIRSTPESDDQSEGGDGGIKHSPHPRRPFPRRPRRGPHGDPPLPSPPRTRHVVARARRLDHA